jgi:hypothetical protein
VLFVDKKEHRTNKKMQMVCEFHINEIVEANVFTIVCRNFKVTLAGTAPFPDEVAAPSPTAPTDDQTNL